MTDHSTIISLIETRSEIARLKKKEDMLKRLVLSDLGEESQTVDVAGHGKVTVVEARKTRALNVNAALAGVLGVDLATRADRKAQLAQLEKALREQGHKTPQKTSKVSASLRVTANA